MATLKMNNQGRYKLTPDQTFDVLEALTAIHYPSADQERLAQRAFRYRSISLSANDLSVLEDATDGMSDYLIPDWL